MEIGDQNTTNLGTLAVIRRGVESVVPANGGTPFQGCFRYGCHYATQSAFGDPAWTIDLYQRKALVSGKALAADVTAFPAEGSVVTVEGMLFPRRMDCLLWVRRFEPVGQLPDDICIFDLVLPQWVLDGEVIDGLTNIWRGLSTTYRAFINTVFADQRLMRGFLVAPGSVRHHDAEDGGCARHTLMVARHAEAICALNPHIHRDLLITAALLHDIGKAYEYTRTQYGRWRMSSYGRRVGHKISGIQVVTLALSRFPDLSAAERENLIHALSSSYAPTWVGLRAPATREALALSAIDRLCSPPPALNAPQ